MDNTKNISISIIVPCYNQGQYLDDALQSVLAQTFTDWECIIVNDGSIDSTKEISNKWLKKDPRFKYISQQNRGLSAARNLGISKAKGRYVLPLDADDKIGEDYLKLAYDAYKKDSELKVVYCQAEKFGIENKRWMLRPYTPLNLAVSNIIFCSAMFKKEDWLHIGGYDENMKGGLEDWEFWIHLLKNGGKVKQLDQVCFFYRIKHSSMIKDIELKRKEHLYQYVSIKHADFFVEQLGSFYAYMQDGLKENKALKVQLNSRKHALKVLIKPLVNLFK